MAKVSMEPPDTLVPWQRNPKGHDDKAILASVDRFGFASAVVARPSDRRILAGHGRARAAIAAGLKEVPVVWVEMDDDAAASFTVADNKLSEAGGWDDAALAEVLKSLDDPSGLGFSQDELDKIINPEDDTEVKEWSAADLHPREQLVFVLDAPHASKGALAEKIAKLAPVLRVFMSFDGTGP